MTNSKQFVVLPNFGNLSNIKIKYTDALTYIAVRSFDGYNGCFPSYESIAAKASCSRDFVIKSLKRLETAAFIQIKRGKKTATNHNEVNRYSFPANYMFEQIPYEVFDLDLTLHDKSMLITLRQFFRLGKLEFQYDIKKVADKLGLTYKIVYERIASLTTKGYLISSNSRYSNYEFTDKIQWTWNYGNKIKLKEEPPEKLLVSQ